MYLAYKYIYPVKCSLHKTVKIIIIMSTKLKVRSFYEIDMIVSIEATCHAAREREEKLQKFVNRFFCLRFEFQKHFSPSTEHRIGLKKGLGALRKNDKNRRTVSLIRSVVTFSKKKYVAKLRFS